MTAEALEVLCFFSQKNILPSVDDRMFEIIWGKDQFASVSVGASVAAEGTVMQSLLI